MRRDEEIRRESEREGQPGERSSVDLARRDLLGQLTSSIDESLAASWRRGELKCSGTVQ
jgi:hypothetical protein